MGLKDRFGFSRNQLIGLLSLSFVALAIFLVAFFRSSSKVSRSYPLNDSEIAMIDSLMRMESSSVSYSSSSQKRSNYKKYRQQKILPFDPNELSVVEWEAIGFTNKQAKSIVSFRSRIGGFKNIDDLKKVYVINDFMFDRIKNSVVFSGFGNASDSTKFDSNNAETFAPQTIQKVNIEINLSNESDFQKLRGIGPVLSKRIISFRSKLGGFYSIDQIGEVYGLQDSVFQKVKSSLSISSNNIEKLNINKADESELKNHPYISWKEAKKIVNFKEDWGKIQSLDQLIKEQLVDPSKKDKLSHYIEF